MHLQHAFTWENFGLGGRNKEHFSSVCKSQLSKALGVFLFFFFFDMYIVMKVNLGILLTWNIGI